MKHTIVINQVADSASWFMTHDSVKQSRWFDSMKHTTGLGRVEDAGVVAVLEAAAEGDGEDGEGQPAVQVLRKEGHDHWVGPAGKAAAVMFYRVARQDWGGKFSWFWDIYIFPWKSSLLLILPLPGPSTKHPREKEGKINTSQTETVAASSWAVGQFLSISLEAFILLTR